MAFHKAELNKQALYYNMISEEGGYLPAIALIMTGNGSRLQNLSPGELEQANSKLLSRNNSSLLKFALEYGDLDAIKCLLKSGLAIPGDDDAIRSYLEKLFTQHPIRVNTLITDEMDNEIEMSTEYNKSKDNVINIYHYLRESLSKESDVWANNHTLARLLAKAAKGKEFSTVEALMTIDLNLDLNVPDESGKTAMLYLMQKNDAGMLGKLIEQMQARGAVLNAADQFYILQLYYAAELIQAMASRDAIAIDKSLQKLTDNPKLLPDEKINECLDVATRNTNEKAISALIKIINERHYSINHYSRGATLEANYLLALGLQTRSQEKVSFTETLESFTHRIGLSGSIKSNNNSAQMSLESGSTVKKIFPVLHQVVSQYQTDASSFNEIREAVNFTANVINITEDLYNHQIASDLHFRGYNDGRLQFIPAQWHEHGLGMAIKYNPTTNTTYVSITNRGIGRLGACLTEKAAKTVDKQATGTIIYSLEGKISQDFFDIMCRYSDIRMTMSDFTNAIKKHLANAKAEVVLPAENQGRQTCGYVNRKRAIEGIFAIQSLCEGAKIDQTLLDNIYNQYKNFSVDDKAQASKQLIEFYQAHQSKNDLSDNDMDLLIQFMIKVVITHHSDKNNSVELASARAIFAVLPPEAQAHIAKVAPDAASAPSGPGPEFKLFSNTRRLKNPKTKSQDDLNITITGDQAFLKTHADQIQLLKEFLRNPNIDNKTIKKISVGADKFTIYTIGNRDKKTELRESFEKQIGTEHVKNVQGKFEFEVDVKAPFPTPNKGHSPV